MPRRANQETRSGTGRASSCAWRWDLFPPRLAVAVTGATSAMSANHAVPRAANKWFLAAKQCATLGEDLDDNRSDCSGSDVCTRRDCCNRSGTCDRSASDACHSRP